MKRLVFIANRYRLRTASAIRRMEGCI